MIRNLVFISLCAPLLANVGAFVPANLAVGAQRSAATFLAMNAGGGGGGGGGGNSGKSGSGRVALVSGANKGIGFEVAKGLASEGFTTVLGCRNRKLGEAAAESLRGMGLEDVSFELLDLTEEKSWSDCAEAIKSKHGRLDVLCNNAAICFNDPTLFGKCEYTPFEGQAEITVRTNFFGTLGVTRACMPLLRESTSPRVINIASAAGRLSIIKSKEKAAAVSSPGVRIDELETLMNRFVADVQGGVHAAEGWPNTCYGVSKVGVIAMTRALARDEPTCMFNSVDPGYCATDQNANSGTLPASVGARTPVALALLPDSDFRTGGFFTYKGEEVDWTRT